MLTRTASCAIVLAVVIFLSATTVGRPAGRQTAAQAIVGGTIIDGNGGPPIRDAIIVVTGQRITAIGPRSSVRVPPGATVIDAAGKYVVPGFIDTNVHLSLYGGVRERYETLVRYHSRQDDIVLEAAQIELKHGVTTVVTVTECSFR